MKATGLEQRRDARVDAAAILRSIRARQKRRRILAEKNSILATLRKLPLRRLREIHELVKP